MITKFITLPLFIAAGVVAHPALLRRADIPPLSQWAGAGLESYWSFKVRYQSLGCASQTGTDFYNTCCYPLPSGQTTSDLPAECNPSTLTCYGGNPYSIASTTTPAASPTPTPDASTQSTDDSSDDNGGYDDSNYTTSSYDDSSYDDDEDCDDGSDDDDSSDDTSSSYNSYTPPDNSGDDQSSNDQSTDDQSTDNTPDNYGTDNSNSGDNSNSDNSWSGSNDNSGSNNSGSNDNSGSTNNSGSTGSSNSGNANENTGGFATYFYQNGNAGACGQYHSDSDYIGAIDIAWYGDTGSVSQYCGRSVHIVNTNTGASVDIVVADVCPTCDTSNSFDLSYGAFSAIAAPSEGEVPIVWWFN